MKELTIAVPKGRLLAAAEEFLRRTGLYCGKIDEETPSLVRKDENNKVRLLLVRPGDVTTYVEEGVADLGITGKDVLLEQDMDVFEVYDLARSRCHLAVAAPRSKYEQFAGPDDFYASLNHPIRVGTKYPAVAESHFSQKGISCRTIPLKGSVELAPLTGLSEIIVDVVATGSTLRANHLVEVEKVADSSARLLANRVSLKTNPRIGGIVASLHAAGDEKGERKC